MKAFFNFFIICLLVSMCRHVLGCSERQPIEQLTWYYKHHVVSTDRVPMDDDTDTMATFIQYRSIAGDSISPMFYQGEDVPDSVLVGEW